MKNLAASLFALTFATASSFAGGFGPGPWANGAYYDGQFNGYYSATVSGTNAISGIIGFGLFNGTPTTSTNTSATSITVNPNDNYFVIYLNGRSFVGTTVANINNNSKQVSGGLFNGVGPSTTVVTNSGTNIITTSYQNIGGGGFNANLTSDKAIITFSGNNTGIFAVSTNGIPVSTNTFSLNGLKVGNRILVSQ
jgi:hypothetical protein